MQNVMFMGWNRPFVGREKLASELFTSWLGYWAGQQKEGNIESFEPVLLSYHGGDMNGFMFVRGDVEKLDEIRNSEQFVKLSMQTNHAVQGFGIVPGYSGDALVELMGQWNEMI